MFHKILPETRKLTMNKYGSRVAQTAFSYVTPEQHTEWTKVRQRTLVQSSISS
jgi:hypothetical protein